MTLMSYFFKIAIGSYSSKLFILDQANRWKICLFLIIRAFFLLMRIFAMFCMCVLAKTGKKQELNLLWYSSRNNSSFLHIPTKVITIAKW